MNRQPPLPDTWPAPAKLNRFLHITGRRADGYHQLQTVFQYLDYGDALSFVLRNDAGIRHMNPLPGVPPAEDLTVRAARLLQRALGQTQGVEIRIHKRLPMGGGLGGGSSNAATTLVALNRLWQGGLGASDLARLGLELGADVPVFVHGQAAWAEGVGEMLTPIELPAAWFVVLVPQVNISTAEVFSAPELIRDCPPITIRDFLAGRGVNVCEAVVRSRYPQVAAALDALAPYGEARMTGTGACVFAVFQDEQDAQQAWTALRGQWQGFVARGLNTSPLREFLEA